MGHWTLDDIRWERFDRAALDAELVRIVRAAALVEHNGAAYAHHLCRIFDDDPEFQTNARRWGEEEIQHGRALARWARLADPSFDFDRAFSRFQDGFRVDFDSDRSRRGSRAGEMVARCIVEIGTSSYYSALGEAAAEPVLKEICRHIAADEIRHYRLFRKTLERCLESQRLPRWRRLKIALGRVTEAEDDELAYAYYAANEEGRAYDRRHYSRLYASRAYPLYRPHHVERGIAMLLKAIGLTANGWLARVLSRLAWWLLHHRARRLARVAM